MRVEPGPFSADMRGSHPFMPVVNGEVTLCPQIPTTLPTLDELIGIGDITPDNVHQHVLAATQHAAPHGHVYTLHAELEGMRRLPVFDRLLGAWRAEGVQLVGADTIAAGLDRPSLPRHRIAWAEVPGRSGLLATQEAEFLV